MALSPIAFGYPLFISFLLKSSFSWIFSFNQMHTLSLSLSFLPSLICIGGISMPLAFGRVSCMRFVHACSIYDIPRLNLSFLSSGLYTCAYTYVKHQTRSHPPVFSLLNPCLLLSHLIPFSSSLAGPRRCRRAVVCIPSSAFRSVLVYTDNNAVYDILRSLTLAVPCHHKMRMEGKCDFFLG